MNLKEFTTEFVEEIRNESFIQNDTPSNVFLEEMSNRLQSMEYLFNPNVLQFFKYGTHNRVMRFDLYAYDDIDKSLILLINDYTDDTEVLNLNQSDIDMYTKQMLAYIDEIIKGTIFKYIDPSHDAYKLAKELQERLQIDYSVADNDMSIERIKLFIITNKKIGVKVSNKKIEDFHGRQVELNVWDIERIYDVVNSGRDKESVIIDVPRFNEGNGIPYLKADFGANSDYDAYLAILPGKFLSDIYWEHGSRLLEGNVRAFLSNKGKVNKGIRKTIKEEPKRFFTYNNGIACTARKITFSDDNKSIVSIEDIQIINGGQTTASLTSAWKKEKATLENIYVPMKLTVINVDEYDELIQNISRYANSQNKVTDADLFSNHPFHRRFEKLSQKYPAPAKQGENYNTFWFYERSRGKYQQSQFKLSKKSEQEAYARKYPKNQVISKEDLAKYLMAGRYHRPDLVSRGKARNMSDFALLVDKQWKTNDKVFNEAYYKYAICYAIMFKTIDKHVANSSWYQKGGVKLNIVPYTMAKIMSSIPSGFTINFNKIWREQALYPSFMEEIDIVAKMADEFINNAGGVIPTEYAKKDNTWKEFKAIKYKSSIKFIDDLVEISIVNSENNQAEKNERENQKINIEIEIYNLAKTENGNYWNRLLDEGLRRGIISLREQDIIKKYICELAKISPRVFPTPEQYKIAWQVRDKLDKHGVLV